MSSEKKFTIDLYIFIVYFMWLIYCKYSKLKIIRWRIIFYNIWAIFEQIYLGHT